MKLYFAGPLLSEDEYSMNDPVSTSSYDETGALTYRAVYEDGRENILFYSYKGRTLIEDGEGHYITYFDDGTVNTEGNVLGNVKTGQWTAYYPDGSLLKVSHFEDGVEYVDRIYNSDGSAAVQNGTGEYISYYESGEPMSSTSYSGGLIAKMYTLWSESGQELVTQSYMMGKPFGQLRHFSEDGVLIFQGTMKNGLMDGKVQWFDENTGELESEVRYDAGQKTGEQNFYRDGYLIKTENYDNGTYVDTVLP